jgi:1,4-dihydroxy-2-naphthoate octaprenyltransferase
MSSDGDAGGQARQPTLAVWIRALRAPFLTASALPVLLGASAAYWKTGALAWERLAAAVGGAVCLHLGANLANDYFDYRSGCDDLNPEPTPYSGGSRVIQHGLISARALVAAACLFLALGVALGLWLFARLRGSGSAGTVLWLGLAGLAGGVAYSAGPLRLSYRGAGEAVVFLLFGPLAVAGGYLSQAGTLSSFAWLVSVPAGLLVLAILLVNEVLDVQWDAEAGKRTLVVRLGRERGYGAYLAAYFGAYLWLGAGIVAGLYPLPALAALVPLAAAGRLAPGVALGDRASTIRASGITVVSHTISAALIVASYLVARAV